MDITEWTKTNQNCLDHLEIHLQHWQEFLESHELSPRIAASSTLKASVDQHTKLAVRTLLLLEQQRRLMARLDAYLAKARQVTE